MTRNHWWSAVAATISVVFGLVAWEWRTGAVGGSDSACYALMARVFSEGAVEPRSVLAAEAPWPDASRVAAPAGFLPSALRAGAAVPVCAPGYSLLITPLVVVLGGDAVHLVPPFAAALLVWLSFVLGRRLVSPAAGVAAAALVATTPIVLFQAVQPMNDITTGALWLAVAVAMCAAHPAAVGALVGLAVLVRPNLIVAGVMAIAASSWLRAKAPQPGWLLRATRAAVIGGLGAAPGVLAALGLNQVLYGSPLQSGYGSLEALFAAGHVPVNLVGYGRTWIVGGTPIVLTSAAAWWCVSRERRAEAAAVSVLAVALSLVYLAYRPFDDWWFLRFLLPSVALAAVLAAVSLTAIAGRRLPRAATPMVLLIVVAIGLYTWRTPHAREARGLQGLEARFPDTAAVVAERLDAGAVPITIWQSGGLRFWPGREVLVWDSLDPQWLDTAVSWLQTHGRQPAIIVERWEEAGFRTHFDGQTYGALDWPPRYDVDRRVRIFLPEDREPYVRGEGVATELVFGPALRRSPRRARP